MFEMRARFSHAAVIGASAFFAAPSGGAASASCPLVLYSDVDNDGAGKVLHLDEIRISGTEIIVFFGDNNAPPVWYASGQHASEQLDSAARDATTVEMQGEFMGLLVVDEMNRLVLLPATGQRNDPLGAPIVHPVAGGASLVAAGFLDDNDTPDAAVYCESAQQIHIFLDILNHQPGNPPSRIIGNVPRLGRGLCIGDFADDNTQKDDFGDILLVHAVNFDTVPGRTKMYVGKNNWNDDPDPPTDSPLDDEPGDVRPGKGAPVQAADGEISSVVIITNRGEARKHAVARSGTLSPSP